MKAKHHVAPEGAPPEAISHRDESIDVARRPWASDGSGVHERLSEHPLLSTHPPPADGTEALRPGEQAAAALQADLERAQSAVETLRAELLAKSAELERLQQALEVRTQASHRPKSATRTVEAPTVEASTVEASTAEASTAEKAEVEPATVEKVAAEKAEVEPATVEKVAADKAEVEPAIVETPAVEHATEHAKIETPAVEHATEHAKVETPAVETPAVETTTDSHEWRMGPRVSQPRDLPSYPELSRVAFAAVEEEPLASDGRGMTSAKAPFAQQGEPNGSTTSLRSNPEDRRSDPRISCEINVEFEDDTQFFAGLSLDVSRGGLFIATYRLLPIGTPVGLRFSLRRGGTEIRARGQVRWVRETATTEGRPGIGVAFTSIAPEAVTAIEAFSSVRPPLVFDEEDWT